MSGDAKLSSAPAAPAVGASARVHWLLGWPAAAVILVIAYALGLSASRANSATFDEPSHLVGGYIHWRLGDYYIHTENGFFPQALAAAPLLMSRPRLPDQHSEAFVNGDHFALGRDFLFKEGNDAGALLFEGRAAIGVLMVLTGMVVYGWSRKLFGAGPGLLSVFVFAFSPVVLAHGFLITSDMAVTCFFVISLAAVWWVFQRVTAVRVMCAGVALGVLALSKMSAPIILPALVLMAVVRAIDREPLPLGRWRVSGVAGKSGMLAGVLGVLGGIAAVVIWGAFGFRFSAVPAGVKSGALDWSWALQEPGLVLRTIGFAYHHRLLPEAYLYGYAKVVQTTRVAICFANGVETRTGWWWFYPYVFVITTPIAVLLLMVLAGWGGWAHVRRTGGAGRVGEWRELLARLEALSPLVFLLVAYWAVAIASYRGTGPRHLLPAYPVLCILLGAAARVPMGARWRGVGGILLCGWLLVEGFLVRPHYLSSFNELVGGPSNAYHYLVDSSLDWGQDLPALGRFLRENGADPRVVYLSYFGSAYPEAYGVKANALPGFLDRPAAEAAAEAHPLGPGIYCISATMVQDLYGYYGHDYTPAMEQSYRRMRAALPHREEILGNPNVPAEMRALAQALPHNVRELEFARLSAYLRRRRPMAQAGYSINIYEVSPGELNAALNGPPPFDPPVAGGR